MGEGETWRRGDLVIGRLGEMEIGKKGDGENWRLRDEVNE